MSVAVQTTSNPNWLPQLHSLAPVHFANGLIGSVQELFRRLFGLGGATSQQRRRQQQQQQRRRQQQSQQGQWQRDAARPASAGPRDPGGYYKALGVRPDATRDEIQVLGTTRVTS